MPSCAAISRSTKELARLQAPKGAEDLAGADALERLLATPHRVGVVVLLAPLPFPDMPAFEHLTQETQHFQLPGFGDRLRSLTAEFENALAG